MLALKRLAQLCLKILKTDSDLVKQQLVAERETRSFSWLFEMKSFSIFLTSNPVIESCAGKRKV